MTQQRVAPEGGAHPETMSNADWLNAALGWLAAGEIELAKAKIEEVAEELAAEQDHRARPFDRTGDAAPPAPVGLTEMEVWVGGAYRMPDGRSFWIDGVTAREIAKRALGLSPSSNDRLIGGSHDR